MASAPPRPKEDLDELVARARLGDRASLEAVLAAIAPAVHRFGLRMCKNVHDAEDVLQDTLLNIARNLGDFEGRSALSSWAFSLAHNACVRKRRGLKNRPAETDLRLAELAAATASPESLAGDQELVLALSNALDQLSDDHREVILLRDVEGLSAPEAAAVLGVSLDALKSRLHRAREALREKLRPFVESPQTQGSCPDVAALWSKKLDGDLSRDDCAAMEQHLAGCATCGVTCDALKRALFACQSLRSDAVPPEVQTQVRAAMRAWTERRTP